jgi:hypothetical protein
MKVFIGYGYNDRNNWVEEMQQLGRAVAAQKVKASQPKATTT